MTAKLAEHGEKNVKKQIAEIKGLSTPPTLVGTAATLLLLLNGEIKNHSWPQWKKSCADANALFKTFCNEPNFNAKCLKKA